MDKVSKKSDFWRKIAHFLVGTMGEQEGEKERVQDFFLQSLEFRLSEFVGARTKVHRLDEGYACVPKRRDFTENPKEEIWGNQSFQIKEVFLRPPTFLLHFKRLGFFLLWFQFHLLGYLKGGCCVDVLRDSLDHLKTVFGRFYGLFVPGFELVFDCL